MSGPYTCRAVDSPGDAEIQAYCAALPYPPFSYLSALSPAQRSAIAQTQIEEALADDTQTVLVVGAGEQLVGVGRRWGHRCRRCVDGVGGAGL